MRDSYLQSIMKIWDFNETNVILASILACMVTLISTFSQNYLGISGSFGIAMAIVIIVDFITGIAAAKKLGKQVTSRKGLRSLYKTGAYITFLYIAFSLKQEVKEGLFQDVIGYFHVYLIAHICFWELFSIDENLGRLGIDLGLTDTLRGILNKLKNKIISEEKEDIEEEDEIITYNENEGSNNNKI